MTDKQEHDTATLEILTKRMFNHICDLEGLATEIVALTTAANIPFEDKYKVSNTLFGVSQTILECWAQSDEWCAGG